jgi:PhzF family phenazine biosynthesis protein
VRTIYQIDAFAEKLFTGNPAAVVPLESWLEDSLMQKIAMENNLAETAFFVPAVGDKDYDFEIRWFTPGLEINLCGHATLASGFVLFNYLGFEKDKVVFSSKSGLLAVSKQHDKLELDFPSWMPERITMDSDAVTRALGGVEIIGIYKNRDIVVELNSEADVKNCNPDFTALKGLGHMLMITAPGKEVDYVCRFFAPTAGIDEDPVTGSAHAQLIPFWAEKLGKKTMIAKQLSPRGGTIYCEQKGERVSIGGTCVFYMEGKIDV